MVAPEHYVAQAVQDGIARRDEILTGGYDHVVHMRLKLWYHVITIFIGFYEFLDGKHSSS